jgi:uncharacterized protein YjbI with pentapeptide repeats
MKKQCDIEDLGRELGVLKSRNKASLLNHSKFNHSKFNHSKFNHSKFNHSKFNHSIIQNSNLSYPLA